MDEMNTMQTEQAESTGTPDAMDEAFDSGWEGDGWNEGSSDTETAEESEGTETDADRQEDEGTDGDESNGETSPEGEAAGDAGKPDQAETFTLRHLGEERTVDRDEVIKLAQQGMDYQRIREKWDGIKDDVAKLRMYEGFLQELADARGGDIDSLIDETRTRSLIAQAEGRGERLDASAAAAQAVQARMKAMEPAKAEQQKEADEELGRKRSVAVDRFNDAFPEVKLDDVPEEVFRKCEENLAKYGDPDLVGEYTRHRNVELEAEIKRLNEELEQATQQQKNRERSMGSSKSVGSAASVDAFDEGWNSSW